MYSGRKRQSMGGGLGLVQLSKKARRIPLGQAVKQAYQRKMLDGELKYSDIATNTVAVNIAGSITLLHVPILGSDFNARIGRKTTAKSLFIRGIWASDVLGSVNTQLLRMIVFEDKQPTPATAVTVLDVLATAAPTSHLNPNNRDRFKVLCDQEFALGPQNVVTPAFSSPAAEAWKIYKKIKIESIFNATNGGTFADITSGAIYVMFIGSLAAGNGDGTATWSSRVRYSDK